MATNYITLANLKATLNITGTAQDTDLTNAVNAASRAVDRICRRRFWEDASDVTRYYSPDRLNLLEIDDLVSLTTLSSDDDGTYTYANSWTQNTDFLLEPLNAPTEDPAEPWTQIRVHPSGQFLFNTFYPRSVKLVGKFGWAAIPDQVVDATTMIASRIYKIKREAPLGALVLDQVAIRAARSDPTVMLLLGPLVRHRIAVG